MKKNSMTSAWIACRLWKTEPPVARMLSIAAIALLTAVDGAAQTRTPLTLEQLFRGPAPQFTKPLPSITGWKDAEHYIEERSTGPDSGRTLVINARSGRVTGARTGSSALDALQHLLPDGITASRWIAADREATLFVYSFANDLYLLDVRSKSSRRLTDSPSEEQNPTLSPDATRLAFTRDHDLYSLDLRSGQERRYTRDGSDVILNGRASWVYWEEIFGRPTKNRAFWWSPDGSRIAFFRFDDSRVPLVSFIPASGPPEHVRYPRAGDPNPEARLATAFVEDGSVLWADFDRGADQYFGTPFWTPDSRQLFTQWMNRGQDTLILYAVDPATGAKQQVYLEHQPAWVDWVEDIAFLEGGRGFVIRSDNDGWAHLYLHSMNGRLLHRLTSGEWGVEKVVAVNEKEGALWFTARKESSTRVDLYRVGLDGTDLRRLSFGPFTHSIDVAPGGSFFLTTYSNVSTPPRLALLDGGGGFLRELGDSRTPLLEEYELAATRVVEVPTADGLRIPALLTLPPVLAPGTRYPVLLTTYGGPGSPSVSDSWRLFVSDQGRAYAGLIQMTIDHRGSGHSGKAGQALMHRNLGKWEMNDYCEAVKWLRRQPYVDSTKICITGASYGGYVAALALTYGADYFTHGIANLSVTDWLLYDSHYTEKYMDSPAENPDGYREWSVMTHAGKYKGLLRLVHGALDDNVHVQHALRLADTLQSLNKHFELMLYPDQHHGVGGSKFNHYRTEAMRFYYRHLLQKEFPEELFRSRPRVMGSPH